MKYNKYFLITIFDIGFSRILGRVINDFKKIIYKFLPSKVNLLIANSFYKKDKFKKTLGILDSKKIFSNKNLIHDKFIKFDFLNDGKLLSIPFDWNSKEVCHLWRFNLHYFDWGRVIIEDYISKVNNENDINNLNFLINDWIDKNNPGKGDGWHSYTISLRIRNWILIFRTFPDLVNEKYINSLWQQILWLFNNREKYLGGNHWIENLISLIIGSSQFDGNYSKKIFAYAIKNLKEELDKQILNDGGHIERSASYHILILDRLVELGLILENIYKKRPVWLLTKIKKMREWLVAIKLNNNKYPIFNDSPDFSINIQSIINSSYCYLNSHKIEGEGIKNILSKIYFKNDFLFGESVQSIKGNQLINLLDTGWIIVRLKNYFEIVFKVGDSCPKYLPAHAHSDLLSFDIFNNGVPIIAETGTSIYGENNERYYERSGSAHNIFQLAPFVNKNINAINWIEPIEVWGNFRAARKAKIIEKIGKILDDGTIFMKGSNDSSNRFGAQYSRIIKIKELDKNIFSLEVIDEVNSLKKMYWRQLWHLGPKQSSMILKPMVNQLKNKYLLEENLIDTWFSLGFGKRENRKTLKLNGVIEPGNHIFKTSLILKNN